MFRSVASLLDGIEAEQLLTGTWYGGWVSIDQLTPAVEANVIDVLNEQAALRLAHLREARGYVGDFGPLEYVTFAAVPHVGVGWRARFQFEPRGGA